MANIIYKIKNIPVSSQEQTQIMTVFEVHDGEASSLITKENSESDNKITTNFTHASSVPSLFVGDKVIVQFISGYLIIIDKIRNSEEKPTVGFDVNNDGSLSLYSTADITLKTENATIEILKNGKILIDGNEIYSISHGINRMQGTSIELN